MMTFMKMIFSIVKILLTICWKIVKWLSGPMCDSLKDLGKGIKNQYKERKEMRAAAAGVEDRSISSDISVTESEAGADKADVGEEKQEK